MEFIVSLFILAGFVEGSDDISPGDRLLQETAELFSFVLRDFMNFVVEVGKIVTEKPEDEISDDEHDYGKRSLTEDKEGFDGDRHKY